MSASARTARYGPHNGPHGHGWRWHGWRNGWQLVSASPRGRALARLALARLALARLALARLAQRLAQRLALARLAQRERQPT